jgi:hypothetical protein
LSDLSRQSSKKTQNFGNIDEISSGLPKSAKESKNNTIVALSGDYTGTIGTIGSQRLKKSERTQNQVNAGTSQTTKNITEVSLQESSSATAEGPMQAVMGTNRRRTPRSKPLKKRGKSKPSKVQHSRASRSSTNLSKQVIRNVTSKTEVIVQ